MDDFDEAIKAYYFALGRLCTQPQFWGLKPRQLPLDGWRERENPPRSWYEDADGTVQVLIEPAGDGRMKVRRRGQETIVVDTGLSTRVALADDLPVEIDAEKIVCATALEGVENLKFPTLYGCCVWVETDTRIPEDDLHFATVHFGEGGTTKAGRVSVDKYLELVLDKQQAVQLGRRLLEAAARL